MKRRLPRGNGTAHPTRPGKRQTISAPDGDSRNLERIADLATNIAEDVIYLAEGKIIRHGEKG